MMGTVSAPRPVISSLANPRVKAAAALRDRRTRERTGLTLVDGARELRRAVDAGVVVEEAFIHEPRLAGEDARSVLDALRTREAPLWSVSESVLAKLGFGDRNEGIVAVVRPRPLDLEGLELPADPLLVVVEDVEKPGNLGAVLRSADGAGADAVIAASPRTDLANPNVIRASAGTCFTIPMASAESPVVLAWLLDRGIRPVAAVVGAATSYADADLAGPVALVLGTEDEGLTDVWSGAGIAAVSLPMLGVADSLNVSVTAAVLLYEARRQRDRNAEGAD